MCDKHEGSDVRCMESLEGTLHGRPRCDLQRCVAFYAVSSFLRVHGDDKLARDGVEHEQVVSAHGNTPHARRIVKHRPTTAEHCTTLAYNYFTVLRTNIACEAGYRENHKHVRNVVVG